MKRTVIYNIFIFGLAVMLLASCQQAGKNNPGSEYMPDMGHSIAIEANVNSYYYHNTWGTKKEYSKWAQPRLPVEGTVPHIEGYDLYHYMDTEEERTRASAEIIENPYPITDAGLEKGKELYTIFCGVCHGDKGDGGGYLVRDDGGVYPAQPANFLLPEFLEASNGRYYHSIMYGKNMMGSYRDKLNTEERWQVIQYIRSLQATELKLEYNQMVNTLNTYDKPAGEIVEVVEEVHEEGSHDHDHGHGDDHGHDHDSH